MNRKKGILVWLVSMLSLVSLVLAGCSSSAAQANATATSQAMQDMHMQETQTAMDDMHAQETQAAMDDMQAQATQTTMDDMHAQETQTAMDDMHAQETQTAMDDMHMQETQTAMDDMHAQETQTAMDDMHTQETQTAMDDMYMQGTEPAASMGSELTLHIDGLPDLGAGWAYEGWLIVDGSPFSTGIFTVDDHMMMSAETFPIDPDMLSKAAAFVLTIEPSPDSDPAPSPVHILAGDFNGDTASLSVAHSAALGSDFTAVTGAYVLAAPTGGAGADYKNGIWFLDPTNGPSASLTLPELPAGWVYEGWVVPADASMAPVSTGRFTAADMVDRDGAGSTAGPSAAPPFPGQDFINPAMNLVGYGVVITIEPEPDTSLAPFGLKPLAASAIQDLSGEALQPLENQAASFPTGTATR